MLTNYFSGGISDPDRLTFNSLLLLDISVDTEKMAGWNGGLFGVEFLQLNAQNTNMQAGSIQEYNSIPGSPPLNRFEVYQLWYRQELFNKKLIVRLGKSVPTFDFGNVVKPVSLNQSNLSVPAATSLLYTPIFINPAMIGVMPGYYNSAFGVTISFIPGKTWYFSYGIYDGNLASGKQTGLTGPNFNGAYFQIAETGSAWLLGTNSLPGNIGIGAWHQDGLIQQSTPNLTENSASGFYLFGTQRLWYKNPGENNSGIATFYQYGTTNSNVLPMQKYIGTGLTGFGLVPHRPDDSMGIGAAFSWLNQHSFTRSTELMFQAYYQAKIINGIYLEPALSYIPTPGASANLPAAWAGTIRTIVLF
jgi:porin